MMQKLNPDCQAASWTDLSLAGLVNCPHCRSSRIEPLDESVEPPFPAEFGELSAPLWLFDKAPSYTWAGPASTTLTGSTPSSGSSPCSRSITGTTIS